MFPCVFFKLSNGTLGNNTLLVASLGLAIQGFPALCWRVSPPRPLHPAQPFSSASFPGTLPPHPLAHAASEGLREVPRAGGSFGLSSAVTAGCKPAIYPISGRTHGA